MLKEGDVVFFTRHYAEWLREINPKLDITLIHKIAKIIKIIDWETDEGRAILKEREATGKWKKLNSKDFKYILRVYHPDIVGKDKKNPGVIAYEVLPKNYPGLKEDAPLFDLYPKTLLEDIFSEDLLSPTIRLVEED